MATVICFGTEKGGAGKTTTAAIIAFLMAKTKRVLAVDMDLQGNLTSLLSGVEDITQFNGRTVFEAMKQKNPRPYIVNTRDNLDLLPANGYLAALPRYLYLEKKTDISTLLKETLSVVQDDYDVIIIDTPPALGEFTINALAASEYVVVLFEPSMFGLSSIGSYFTTIKEIQENVNPNLQIAGILRTIIDNRRVDNKYLVKLVETRYKFYTLRTIVVRQAAVGRIPITGFDDNPELNKALTAYWDLLKELNKRVFGKATKTKA